MKHLGSKQVTAWFNRWFPERQIYVRSQGVVQFYCFTAASQFASFLLLSIFLGWASFATVNVIFKDRIIAAADHRYQQTQGAYENKLAEAYTAFDDLNAALANADARAHTVVVRNLQRQAGFRGPLAGPAPDNVSVTLPPTKPIGRFSSFLIQVAMLWRHSPADLKIQNPLLRSLDGDTYKLRFLDRLANTTIKDAQVGLLGKIGRMRDVIGQTGLQPDQFVQRALVQEDVGGPDIPLSQVRTGIADPSFSLDLLQAEALLNRLSDMSDLLQHMPLASPINLDWAHRSSAFGARLDPFTGHYSFHPGLDFSASLGTAIAATAPGTVVFAGNDGAYGNMVEIDHGYGLRTRYAHLSRIDVAIGTYLLAGAVVGRLGTTGRSTGPHLHYEILYDQSALDPARFLDALEKSRPTRVANARLQKFQH